MTLERHLKNFLNEIEEYAEKYKDLKHQDGDKECEAIFRGKYEAYSFIAKEFKNLLIWHSVIK